MREIIPDAEVKLSIANKTFTVIGDAGTGVFNIPRDRFTIYQALSMSGEVQHAGDYKHVRILRVNEKGTEILEFDIRPKSIIESKYYYIYPNDIIYVQRAPSAFYKIENSWSNFVGVISSSLSLLFTVLYYQKL
jgi:polysaccharide export outer membrane protein